MNREISSILFASDAILPVHQLIGVWVHEIPVLHHDEPLLPLLVEEHLHVLVVPHLHLLLRLLPSLVRSRVGPETEKEIEIYWKLD